MHCTDGALARVERVALEPGRLAALPGQCGSFTQEMIHQESKCKQRKRKRERGGGGIDAAIRRRTHP